MITYTKGIIKRYIWVRIQKFHHSNVFKRVFQIFKIIFVQIIHSLDCHVHFFDHISCCYNCSILITTNNF